MPENITSQQKAFQISVCSLNVCNFLLKIFICTCEEHRFFVAKKTFVKIAAPFLSVREMSRRTKEERDNPIMRGGVRLITSVMLFFFFFEREIKQSGKRFSFAEVVEIYSPMLTVKFRSLM